MAEATQAADDTATLAITMGEPAGVGTEILLSAYKHFATAPPGKGPSFFLVDDPFRVEKVARDLGMDVTVTTVTEPGEAQDRFSYGLPVLPLPDESLDGLLETKFGNASPRTAKAVTTSIDRAVQLALDGEATGIVTLPIHKQALQEAGFKYPGHTEFLGALTAKTLLPEGMLRGPIMMLTAGPFRVVPVTVHRPLANVPSELTTQGIVEVGIATAQALVRDYGIGAPRIAVAGLNPHAGEGGHIGREDVDVIAPAVSALHERGINAIGPLSADTMFHEEARAQYDVALAMYHDQALIPIKTVAFYAAINVTLGLPIVRTSPDHGTALPIAGQKKARADSLVNAIYAAARIANARTAFDRHNASAPA